MMHGLTYGVAHIQISGVECSMEKGTVSLNTLLRNDIPTHETILNLNWDRLIIPKKLGEQGEDSNFFYLDVGTGTAIQGRFKLKDIQYISGGVSVTNAKPEVTKWLLVKAK